MNLKLLIPLTFINLLLFNSLFGQEFYTSLNNYNRILINPSYSGLNYESNIQSSYSLFIKSKNEVFNEFSFTYDRYSPVLKGGTAFILKQGLQADMNVNTLELGFIYSPRIKKFKDKFFPSVYFGYHKPMKNWFVYATDEWRSNFERYRNKPGKMFLLPDIYKLGAGALLIVNDINIGLSGYYGFRKIKEDRILSSKLPYKLLIHFSKNISSNKNGILSKNRQIIPEFIFHYENGLVRLKSELKVIKKKYTHSFYILNNFTGNFHSLGGSAGFKYKKLQIIISSAIGTTTEFNKLLNYSNVSLGFKIPSENYRGHHPFNKRRIKLYLN